MRIFIFSKILALSLGVQQVYALVVTRASNATTNCTATFTPISASAAYADLNPGWNLGNTLDATPDEGSWNNPPVQAITFSQIQARGFKSVRIPVTWAYHYVDASPTWNINTTWMDRVETVVDEALSLGLYVVLNMHHDSWIWFDVSATDANYTMIEEKFSRSWSQIGSRFACKSSKLLLEAINEPPGTTEAHADELNKLNGIFLEAINDAGGYNPQRVVSLSGLSMNAALTAQYFFRGDVAPNQPWGIQFHYYSPYDFIFDAWGKTIWGSDSDKESLHEDFALFAGNFTDVPAFVGEWDASVTNTETAARWKYFDYFIQTCNYYGYSSIIWDNGLDQFDRTTDTWYDPVTIDILFNAVEGVTNTLADSTTDPAATSQNTSAYLFHKVGDSVVDQSVDYLLNGNTLTSITDSENTTLSTSHYSFSSTGTLTLTSAYLTPFFATNTTAGIKETLTLSFSAGASLTLQIVQYDTPILETDTYAILSLDNSTNLNIPITYQGLPEIAAVKAIKADGTYLVDTWTVYDGPLQQGTWTYGDWEWDSGNFILVPAGIEVLQAAGQTVILTLEFFPRSLGANEVNVTFIQ